MSDSAMPIAAGAKRDASGVAVRWPQAIAPIRFRHG